MSAANLVPEACILLKTRRRWFRQICERASARRVEGEFHDMVFGMATTKITITLPDEQIQSIRELVAAERASSVSAFVKHAIAVALFDAAGWREMLNDALRETGGPLTNEERKWADALLHPSVRKPVRKPERKKATGSRNTRKNRAA